MSSSTASEKHSTSANNRSHNQGSQNKGYTPAQVAAVNRVRKCRVSDYYAILDIEKPSSEGEIRKSYRKLALIMHPDKNCAPGADEAFKMVSKAFQVLSDADKKRIFDQTGADPDSRGAGGMGPSGFSGFSRAAGAGSPGMHFQGADISPEDLFNMFFGGAGHPAAGGGFGGGPNIRVHTFGGGGGGSPFTAFTNGGMPNRRGQQRPGAAGGPPEEFSLRNLTQLLPLLLLFGLPILMSLFGDTTGGYTNNLPTFKFNEKPPYVQQRTTPHHSIPYYVNPKEITNLNDRKLHQLDRRAEVSYIQGMRSRCYDEYEYKQQKIAESKGWFSTDEEAYNAAMNIPLASCELLDQLGVTYGR